MPDERFLSVGGWGVAADGDVSLTSMGTAISLTAAGPSTSVLIDATSTVSAYCGPTQFILASLAEGAVGKVALSAGAAGRIQLLAGPPLEGSYADLTAEEFTLRLGVPDAGAVITLTPESITLQVGPPGAGASIRLTPEGIVLKVAEVSFSMTPEGVTEVVAEVTREATPEGHNLTAAETELNVGVEGLTYEGPTRTEETEGGTVDNETLGAEVTDAVKNEDAAIKITE